MYRRIVLAYDGSIESRRALREGAFLAKAFNAQVFLLAAPPGGVGLRMADGAHTGAFAVAEEAFRETLDAGVAKLDEMGLTATAQLVYGDPLEQIVAYARSVQADLVVVGLRKQNVVERWWAPNSRAFLSDHLACSVLIARNVIDDATRDHETAPRPTGPA